ncbi:SDR family oxidoreductase [Pseudochelatococcus sp. G4_1912]|uniref:SDR family oxidoreductase n=1 Tax=Pseudochelatococcus sp. G4_1912 TaxID=3114288 RepID=UPI0039C639C8
MGTLAKQVIWITGAGSGIGEAAALTLAAAGATVVLTGRRREMLESVADRIAAAGGTAIVEPGDLTSATNVQKIAQSIVSKLGRLDVLVNNAGVNIRDRSTAALTPEGVDELISTNLSATFYCVTSVLPIFRSQGGGLMIHTASWLGRYNHKLAGAGYSAAKQAVLAMSHSINMEEFGNNIRSCAVCPGEVATPVLEKRPVPVPQEEKDRMLQPQDLADIILMICQLPSRICMNEILVSPTWNRMFLSQEQSGLVAERPGA